MLKLLALAVVLTAQPLHGNAPLSVRVECEAQLQLETINATKQYQCLRASVVVNWQAPTQNAPDAQHPQPWGTAVPTSYRIYYGTSSNALVSFVDVAADKRNERISLEVGKTYYFAMTASDSTGESTRTGVIWAIT